MRKVNISSDWEFETDGGQHHRYVVRQTRQTVQGEHLAQNSAYRSAIKGRGERIFADDKKG